MFNFNDSCKSKLDLHEPISKKSRRARATTKIPIKNRARDQALNIFVIRDLKLFEFYN